MATKANARRRRPARKRTYRCGRIMNCPNRVPVKGWGCTWCSLSMSA